MKKVILHSTKLHIRLTQALSSSSLILFLLGLSLLVIGIQEIAQAGSATTFSRAEYNPELIQLAVGNLFALIEGSFGALIMVVAGLAAIIAAAMGSYKAAVSLLVVAVGAFILRALVSLFFGDFSESYNIGDV